MNKAKQVLGWNCPTRAIAASKLAHWFTFLIIMQLNLQRSNHYVCILFN